MNPIEEHINYYQHFAPNPMAFRESLEGAIVYAKKAEKTLSMDLRDYFAAQAMQGMLTNQPIRHDITLNGDSLAQSSYQIADAMMKAREK